MIPYDIDPSLHNADPAPQTLDDGFAPPPPADDAPAAREEALEEALASKSDF
ncbi:hypothetical protein [Ramlibacter sp.]|uniref:hypothetical protein n=1 Tax=Ramlibacter sp. TaxID=1917967 RepID=UPI003D14E2AB